MALDSDFQINGRIEWRTKVPSSEAPFLDSPTFRLLGSEWYLRFSVCRREEEGDLAMFIYYYGLVVQLMPKGSEGWGEALQTPFTVVTYIGHPTDPVESPLVWRGCRITKRTVTDVWKPFNICDADEYLKLYNLRKGGEVRIICLFYGTDPSPTGESSNLVEKSVQVSSEVPRDVESFCSDFSNLLEKEILPDMKLECGGRTFRAHRSVLGARSEVFRTMLQNETLERETGAVKIQDVDVAVLQKLLKYVYTGKPEDITESTAADLYEAADKYAVLSLKTACAYWIVRNLTVENCVKYLVVADSHSDGNLRAAVTAFIL